MQKRVSKYPIDSMILNRRSSRAISQENLTEEELMTLFEAARWAPSSYNEQPWRFIYATKDMKEWELFFSLLVEANQIWAKNAPVLVLLVSRNTFQKNEKTARCHSFDSGSAFENLALQGEKSGLVVHPMQGFDEKKAREAFSLPENFSIEIMMAIGKPGKLEDLPKELAEKEEFTDRKPLEEIVMKGCFKE